MSSVKGLAEKVGLQVDWTDAAGDPKRVKDADLRRVLGAIGYSAESDSEIAASLERQRAEERSVRFVSVNLGEDMVLPLKGNPPAAVELVLGDGRIVPLDTQAEGGRLRVMTSLVDAPGYHTLHFGKEDYTVALAPRRCFGVGDAAPGRSLWGASVQVPALRGQRDTAFGDFGSLRDAAEAFGSAGADALAISPTHALFPADPSRSSPYGPSSRLFLNILFADPGLIGAAPSQSPASSTDLIDWEQAAPARMKALREAFANRDDGVKDQVAAYRRKSGRELENHCIFDALHAHFFKDGACGWQDWPEPFHDRNAEAVALFAAQNAEEVDFFVFAQWLAETSLDAAQQAATDAGMAVGLIADLAVGMDGGGSHAWSRPGELLANLSVGAPPDLLGPDGQNWGLTAFSPQGLKRTNYSGFIDTLRAAFDHAGGIRIDHILGLRRLWLVPHGASSAEGAYLSYPVDDLLRILAIESQRAHAIVIGEDLGTVPEDLRPKLDQRNVFGMDVLWFEREKDGRFTPPSGWRHSAVAMTGTHDLPTVAGWWCERDIDWASRLGRMPSEDQEAEDREERGKDRDQLWRAFTRSGSADGPCPDASDTAPVADAAAVHVASSACELAIFPLEDIAGFEEQPNIPGTTDEHPNWRRRMPAPTKDLLGDKEVHRRMCLIKKARE